NPGMQVRLVHGSDDPAVPLEVAVEFAAALRDAAYDVSLVVVEGGVHLGGAELMEAAVAAAVAVMAS
ncbi:MAG: alpha/beta hydrolase, partial [Acidimicrobiia bacterium]